MTEQRNAMAELFAACWKDEALKARFMSDPKAAADDAALVLLAQRANGSLRDSQSLLEQLLAFSATRITVAAVHQMLGTAGDERLAERRDRAPRLLEPALPEQQPQLHALALSSKSEMRFSGEIAKK